MHKKNILIFYVESLRYDRLFGTHFPPKYKMSELNDFINDVIDIVEDENYNESESIEKTMEIYSQMKAKINKLISDSELENMDVKQLMSQIIGES